MRQATPRPERFGNAPDQGSPPSGSRKRVWLAPALALATLAGAALAPFLPIKTSPRVSAQTVGAISDQNTQAFYTLLDRYVSDWERGRLNPVSLRRYRQRLEALPQEGLSNEDKAYRLMWEQDIAWKLFESDAGRGFRRSDYLLGTSSESVEMLLTQHQVERGESPEGPEWADAGAEPRPRIVGSRTYSALLQHRGYVNLDAQSLITMMQQDCDTLQRRMNAYARQVNPRSESWRDVYESLRRQHPAKDQVLNAYRREVNRARQFLQSRRLISIPTNFELTIEETPQAMRARLPFAAYLPGHRIMWVTVTMNDDPATEEQQLRDQNYAVIGPTAVHEAFPGHHLESISKRRVDLPQDDPTRKVRMYLLGQADWDATFYHEGWGLYSERLMLDEGYYNVFSDSPQETAGKKLVATRMLLWRATRALLDAQIHTGQITPEQAADFLVQNLMMEPGRARAEVARYVASPTEVTTYYLGMRQFTQMWEEAHRQNPHLTKRQFHDRLMRQALPIPALALKEFGVELPELQPLEADRSRR